MLTCLFNLISNNFLQTNGGKKKSRNIINLRNCQVILSWTAVVIIMTYLLYICVPPLWNKTHWIQGGYALYRKTNKKPWILWSLSFCLLIIPVPQMCKNVWGFSIYYQKHSQLSISCFLVLRGSRIIFYEELFDLSQDHFVYTLYEVLRCYYMLYFQQHWCSVSD